MKGVILAGGSGSRLLPLTQTTNKHLLTVHDRPMIHFPIAALVGAGIDEVLIVTNPQHRGAFAAALGDGAALGLRRLEFASQPFPAGIADALLRAEPFAAGERMCAILGDNLLGRSIASYASAFDRQPGGARFLLKEVPDAHRFGIARFDAPPPTGAARPPLAAIIEKPADPPSNLAVIGVYFYDKSVFDLCRTLRPGPRGELEITDLNNLYIARGDAEYDLLEGWWIDAGTPESLRKAAALAAAAATRR